MSSIKDIQKVIKKFFFAHEAFIGYKYTQYITWLNNLRNSNRYKNLNFPLLTSNNKILK